MPRALSVQRVESGRRSLIADFVGLPFHLYRGCPQWVPGFRRDVREQLRRRSSFFSHSDADFYVAYRGAEPVGRIAVLENRRFNAHVGRKYGGFYFFDAVDDDDVAERLFSAAEEWAASRRLTAMRGPLGFSGMNGAGLLVAGFEHRAAMHMMNYNWSYYEPLVERRGFVKHVDYYSAYLDAKEFVLPERIERIAQIAVKRGRLRVPEFKSRSEVLRLADRIGAVYNESFGDLPEHLPLTREEIHSLARNLLLISDPRLLKVIFFDDEIAGFLFSFPDLSAAMQKARGWLNPITVRSLLRERSRTRRLVINGMGLLPRFRRTGANAVFYRELVRTTKDMGYVGADLVQIKETTDLMLSDIESLGGRIHKTHRIYGKSL